jgi:branched-chain amino acid transport system permease protein
MAELQIFVQLVLAGVLQGGTYALAAFGLSLVFCIANVLNITHGEFLMLGGLVTYIIYAATGWNPFLILLIVIPLFVLVGFLYERAFIRPIINRPPRQLLFSSIVVTVGIATAIEDTTSFIWGPTVKGVSFSMPSFVAGGVVISSLRLTILLSIIALTIFLHFYLKKTFMGKAIRAILQNREGAMVIGINVPRVVTFVFGIAISLAAVAGVFYVLQFTIGPFIGLPLTIRYIAIVMLGGSGSLIGSLVGGLILGVAETFAGFFLGAHWSLTVAFFTLVLVLLVKPEGLFRHV